MKNDDFLIRQATMDDVEAIYDMMLKVEADLPDKTLFVRDDLEEVEKLVGQSGFGVVACDHAGELAGSFLFKYPGLVEDNLGRDVGLTKAQLEQVVHMESVVVLPEYRGNHLQGRMLRFGEALISKSKYHIFLATVSPNNPASYLTFENNGYELVMTKEKYGGFMRRIYQKTV